MKNFLSPDTLQMRSPWGIRKLLILPASVDKPGDFRYQYQHNLSQPFADQMARDDEALNL